MINDKSLEKRLNIVKNEQQIPIDPDMDQKREIAWERTIAQSIFFDLYKTGTTLLASLLYGFGIISILFVFNIIPDTLNIWHALGLGFLFNHLITIFPLMISKLFTRKNL